MPACALRSLHCSSCLVWGNIGGNPHPYVHTHLSERSLVGLAATSVGAQLTRLSIGDDMSLATLLEFAGPGCRRLFPSLHSLALVTQPDDEPDLRPLATLLPHVQRLRLHFGRIRDDDGRGHGDVPARIDYAPLAALTALTALRASIPCHLPACEILRAPLPASVVELDLDAEFINSDDAVHGLPRERERERKHVSFVCGGGGVRMLCARARSLRRCFCLCRAAAATVAAGTRTRELGAAFTCSQWPLFATFPHTHDTNNAHTSPHPPPKKHLTNRIITPKQPRCRRSPCATRPTDWCCTTQTTRTRPRSCAPTRCRRC